MPTASDDNVLRLYLLGRLAQEARESVEEHLFSDDRSFFERLCVEEEQLVDEYAAGQLDDEAREDFERHFLCTDERRAKLEFVHALRAHVERRERRHQGAWDWLRRPIFAPAWALAAAATLLLTLPTVVWQFAGQRAPRGEVSAWLSPELVRGEGGTTGRVRITSPCQVVRLQLDPGLVQYPAYQATLHEVTGEEFWSQGQLTTKTIEGRAAVTLTLPCELLLGGDYYVMLHGVSPGTDPVLVHRYDFRVLRE